MRNVYKAAAVAGMGCLLAACEPSADDMNEATRRSPDIQASLMLMIPSASTQAGMKALLAQAALEKSGCASAGNTPGYVCDFRWGQKQPNGSVSYGQPMKGRFFKSGDQWQVDIAK